MNTIIEDNATTLDQAAQQATAIPQFAPDAFDVSEAYLIQARSIEKRIERGEKLTGIKMGFTSRAKMEQMGVHDLIWGRLTDAMKIPDAGEVNFSKFVHPRCEPEICFLLKKELAGNVSRDQAFDAVESIAPAIEIIDSRFQDFKFSLPDVIADNASSSGYCIGDWQEPTLPIQNLGMILSINGNPIRHGSSAAILGDPIESLIHAARLSHAAGVQLGKGSVVMAGAATAAEFMKPGDHVRADVQSLGSVEFTIE